MRRFDPGGFQPEGRSTTDSGEAWCRWQKRDGYAGWYAQGKHDPRNEPPEKRFWPRVLQLAAVANESRLDQVHCVGPGIFYLGALGLRLADPADGALLLYRCNTADPGAYSEALAPALATGFVYAKDRIIHATAARRLLSEARVRDVFTLGSDGKSWTMPARDRARLWCACLSGLLAACPLAQATTLAEVLPEELPADTRALLRLPRDMESLWNYEPSLQTLWKLALSLATVDPNATAHLVATHHDAAPATALASIVADGPSLTIGAALGRIVAEMKRMEMA